MNIFNQILSSSSSFSSSSNQHYNNYINRQRNHNNYQFSNHLVQQSELSTINNTTNLTTLPTIKSDNNQAIYYYRGESVNRSSIIVSDELVSPLDLTLIIFVLLLWATTILMCINKWGKIRMLEPYQPSFQASDDDDYSSTTTATAKKTTPVVGNIRVPSTSCKSTLNRSTIRIIPSEADLVNMHDSIVIGMGRSLDVGIGPTIGGYGSKVRADYCNNHSPGGIGLNGNTGNGGCGGSESESVNNGLVSNGNGNGGGEIINIPRIEISPICWSDERKCKSLEDVRVRLLS